MITTMISCIQREVARSLTIPQLERIGLSPRVFLSPCDPPGPPMTNLVSREALRSALNDEEDLLFTEDDIDLSATFSERLFEAKLLDAVTYFYLNDKPDRLPTMYGATLANAIRTKQYIEPGIYPLKSYRYLFGTQCLYLPFRVIKKCLDKMFQVPERPADGNFLRLFHDTKEPVYVALPHPVQHRHDRTAREPDTGNKVKRSMSYR
jgi:hypothetical protein